MGYEPTDELEDQRDQDERQKLARLGRQPDQSLIAPPPSAQPTNALTPQPSPKLGRRRASDEAELQRVEQSGSGISQLPRAARIPLKILDTLGSIVSPATASLIPGTELHHRQVLGGLRRNLGQDVEQEQQEAVSAKDRADAQKALSPQEKEEEWAPLQGLTGPNGEPVEYEKHSGNTRLAQVPAGATAAQPKVNDAFQLWLRENPKGTYADFQKAEQAGKPEKTGNDFDQFYKDWLADNNAPDNSHNRIMARKAWGEATQPAQKPPQQLVIGPDGKVIDLKPGMTVPQGSQTPSAELGKPSADEQRRADLANNMNENLDQLEEIVKRRPDLFGAHGAGLLTAIRGAVGTGDEDIARLKAIHEYLGMASVGAHAMRNAQHVGAAADAVMAGFRNSPQAILAAIETARNSTKTFAGDVERSRGRGAPVPANKGGGGKKQAYQKDGKWYDAATNQEIK